MKTKNLAIPLLIITIIILGGILISKNSSAGLNSQNQAAGSKAILNSTGTMTISKTNPQEKPCKGKNCPPTIQNSCSVYIADTSNYRVQKFDLNGAYLSQWGSYGAGNGQFNLPSGITHDSLGNVYVAEKLNNRIQKFDSSGAYVHTWGTFGVNNGEFDLPSSVRADSNNNIFVSDSNNHRVQKFDSNGIYLAQWGTLGWGNGQFINLFDSRPDASGSIYTVEGGSNRVQKFSNTGAHLTQWGTSGSGNGQFNIPIKVAFDSVGNIFVLDSGNNRVQKFDSNGTYLTQWGTSGSGNGQFNAPNDIDLVGGDIYITDTGNNRIQKFSPTGIYVSQWGGYGSGNGQFNQPEGITVDCSITPSFPDLVISDFKWQDVGLAPGNYPISVSAIPYVTFLVTVKNNGNIPVTLPANMTVDVYRGSVSPANVVGGWILPSNITLLPGDTTQFTFASMVTPNIRAVAGTWNLIASVDNSKVVTESDETNNALTKSFTVY